MATDAALDFLAGGGEMGALMREHDWTRSPLGPPQDWPDALKMSVSICLNSRFPMVLWWGPDCIMLYNDAWRPVLGATKHPGGLGRPGVESWPEIWHIIGEQMRGVLERGEASWSEDLLLVFDRFGYNEEAYFTYSYSPIKHANGRVGGVFSAVTETTGRVIGERRLRILRELAERTADAKSVEAACAGFTEVLGAANPDLPFAILYVRDDDRSAVRLLASAGLSGASIELQSGIRPQDADSWCVAEVVRSGRSILLSDLPRRFGPLPGGVWPAPTTEALVLPVKRTGQSGETAGVLVVGINPRRALDDAYRAFLELVAGQLATAITNARAYEEERRRAEALAEIDRAKTAFFSNASHEFRTPLTLMLSPLEDLLMRRPAAETVPVARRELELIHRNGLRLLKLVNTLLDFSRIEAGRVQAVYEPVDLAAYTTELASTFRDAMKRAGLDFTVDCPPLSEPVYVDRDMWEKIVLNLISNAFKYTLEGEVVVGLRAADGGGRIDFTVRDSGIGIPAHELPRLFERFHRIEGQRGRTQEGTGIGLALVQELARLHGGTVHVDSTEGRGTEVTVSIPTGTAHLPADRIQAKRSLPETGITADAFIEEALRWLPSDEPAAEPSFEKELLGPAADGPAPGDHPFVLLADDNADMRDYVRRLLAQHYDVETVADGQAALEAARRRRPDLVISDVMMPQLDGFALLRALRADADLRDVPVILLSARAGEEASVEGLAAGADDYLVKPFSARELLARAGSTITMARLRRQASDVLREEARRLATLNRTGAALAAELDLERLVQTVTDAAVELTGAQFGAFFYNVVNQNGESYMLYTLSGAPRDAFANFPMPRNTPVFAMTFRGEGVVRSDDILSDPRYGQNPPFHGMPPGHLPVRSYLAVPVVSRTGEVLGGLFFGHEQTGVFTERAELAVTSIAAQAAVAIDNARLFRQSEESRAELQRLNAKLERRVEERTREVSETIAQLRDTEQRFRLLVQGVTDYAIFMLDADGFITSWNTGAQRIKGYAPEEIIGQHFSRFYTEEDRRNRIPQRNLGLAVRNGKFEGEGWRVRKDGERFWAGVVLDAIHDETGAVVGFAKVTRDLTEKRAIEEQLRQAQKMEAVGQLTGGIAHDFNNILQVVLGNLDALRRRTSEGEDTPETRDWRRLTAAAMRGAERGATLTQRLLAFSRRQPLDAKPTDVNKLVAGISDLLHRTLGERIAIETVTAGGLWRVSIDPNQLENAILNLAVNARDAMPNGGKLTIETANAFLDEAYTATQHDVSPGQYVLISVTDSGTGMTKETVAKAFEPFFTTKELGQGTGLGLSQVYGFVKQSGGHVKIYSEPGEGTTVKLYLPRLHGEAGAESRATPASAPRSRKGEVVLLVEDDNEVRAATGDMLRELGYRVIVAADGAAGLRLLDEHPEIDLLFTDVGLPGGLNGRQLADRARAKRPDLPVLFTTGYARNAIVHHGRLDPGIELLVKPFTYSALAAKLRQVLEGRDPR